MFPLISTNLLKIPSTHGSPINEYRIHRGRVEFRSLHSDGKPFSYNSGTWRAMDAGDLYMHFVLNTAVAQWLIERLAVQPQTTIQKPPVNPLDST